jgi:hypothetical protein
MTLTTKLDTRNAIRNASNASPIPNRAAIASSLAKPPIWAITVKAPTTVAALSIFCLADLKFFLQIQK